jgi:predicted DNA-binding helix-hairpin-helix protein
MLLQPSQASKILIELGLMVALTLGLNDTNWLLRFKGFEISEDRDARKRLDSKLPPQFSS